MSPRRAAYAALAAALLAAAVYVLGDEGAGWWQFFGLGAMPDLALFLGIGVEERAAAPIVEVVGDPDGARAMWAFAHGMTILELKDRFYRGPTATPRGREG